MDQNDLLVKVAQERDLGSYDALFRHFGPRLNTYFIRQGHDARTAEDLTQDVMLSVWRRAESYRPDLAPASAWIFAIARNRRIDHARSQSRVALDPNEPELLPPTEVPPDEILQARCMARKLADALKKLPEEQSEALRYSYFSNKSQVEIAEETNQPLGTVKSRMRLGLMRLRALMEEA